MTNKAEISWSTYPDPMPGKTFRTTIVKGKKEIGAMLFNAWSIEPDSKIISNEPKKSKVVAVLHTINIGILHRKEGIAYSVMKEWLLGFDRVDTRVDSKAGLKLILKCGFLTGDYVNYIWEKEK